MKRIVLATAAAALMASPALAQEIGGPPPHGTAQVNQKDVGDDVDPRLGTRRGQAYGFVATPGIQAGPYAYSYEFGVPALDPDPDIRLQQHRELLLDHDQS